MVELSPEKKREIIELVDKQKKAKINWVAMITLTTEEDLIENAESLGLMIEGDYILIPTASKEQKAVELYKAKREQAITEILDKRSYRYDPYVQGEMNAGEIRGQIKKIARDVALLQVKDTLLGNLVEINIINLRRVIYPFDRAPIDIAEKDARYYLENMRLFLQHQQDDYLRIFLPIKKYYELLVISLFSHKLIQEDQKIILERAEIEEINLMASAQQIADRSIIDIQTDNKGFIKELSARMLNGQIVKVKGNQVKQFIRQFNELIASNLRIAFYEQRDIIKELLGKGIQQL